MSETIEALLRAVLSVTGRQSFPQDRLVEIVLFKGAGEKQLTAFNMCDGTKGQAEIAKKLKLDSGNFSRTVSRWVDEGIVFRIGEGTRSVLMSGLKRCVRIVGGRTSSSTKSGSTQLYSAWRA